MNDMTPTHISSSSEDLTTRRGYCMGCVGVWGIATLPIIHFPGDFGESNSYMKQQRRHYLK
jgi:hypothetical protein